MSGQGAPVSQPGEEVDSDATVFSTQISTSGGAAQPRAPAPLPLDSHRSPVGVGYVINKNYEITDVLKSGGMGQVFRGRTIGNEVPVAIKTVLPEHEQVQAVNDLFRKESATLVRLSVEGIVRYFNYIYDEENRRGFLIMEFIEGCSLSDFLEANGALTLDQIVHLFRRVATALGRAHNEEIVHRDLSPDNVMLRDRDIGDAVLIDFGIAKSNVHADVTVGVGAGKYKFMAPEQLGMYKSQIGPWTDVYGLALLMVAACQGRPLEMGSNPSEAVDARRAEIDLGGAPEILRPLLRQMLRPDPKERPPCMQAVLDQLPGGAGATGLGDSVVAVPVATPPPRQPTVPGIRMRPDVTTTLTGTGATGLPGPGQTTTRGAGGAAYAAPRRRGGWIVGPLVAFSVLGGVGYAVWPQLEQLVSANLPTETGPPPESTAPEIEQFLAGHPLAACSYAKLGTDPDSVGLLELFAQSPGQGPDLAAALDTEQNLATGVMEREVTEAQCPALNTLRRMQGRSAVPVELALSVSTTAEGLVTLGGTITDSLARVPTVAFVLPNGKVERVSAGRVAQSGDTAKFSEQFSVFVRGAPVLVLLVATPEPIARLGGNAVRDAAEFLGIVEAELQKPDVMDRSAGRLGYVFLE